MGVASIGKIQNLIFMYIASHDFDKVLDMCRLEGHKPLVAISKIVIGLYK